KSTNVRGATAWPPVGPFPYTDFFGVLDGLDTLVEIAAAALDRYGVHVPLAEDRFGPPWIELGMLAADPVPTVNPARLVFREPFGDPFTKAKGGVEELIQRLRDTPAAVVPR